MSVTLPDFSLCWASYSPTAYEPDIPRFPLPSDIREDVATLVAAGFQGIITYGARDILADVPALAKEMGMRQVILGIWDPLNEEEISSAIAAAPYVDGYIVGNEGLSNASYSLAEVRATMERVRSATGKPVSTSEQLEMYYGESDLMLMGDWLAPIAHPYWHQRVEPAEAAEWTAVQFNDLRKAAPSGRAIQFKELGLPTEGDPRISEMAQSDYYRALWKIRDSPRFSYFEAFDQAWKSGSTGENAESHWGLFNADRSPKQVVDWVCGRQPPAAPTSIPEPSATPSPEPSAQPSPSPAPTGTPAATVAAPSPVMHTILGDSLAPGYDLNIDNSSHQAGWLTSSGGVSQANFLPDQQWAAVFITSGPPLPVGQRNEYQDLSGCDALLVDLWADRPGVEVKVGIKDVDDPDNGAETLLSRVLTDNPLVYRFPLAQFTSADLTRIYLPFEVVYHGREAASVFIDNVRLECRD